MCAAGSGSVEGMAMKIVGWLACTAAVVLLVMAMATGIAPVAAATVSRITRAWVRLPAVPGRPAAGYFTLTAGSAAVVLTTVASPLARVELHGMSMAGGVMRMDALPSVRIAADERASFVPNGRHLMLFDLPASVKPGAAIPLSFRFADGSTVKVDAIARAAGADAPMAIPMAHGAH